MISAPIALLAGLAVLLVVCRPYLEARRPHASIALVIGAALGPWVGAILPRETIWPAVEPMTALLAGCLALIAAESWDLGGLLTGRTFQVLLRAVTAGLVVSGLTSLVPVLLGDSGLAALAPHAGMLTCLAIGLDPTASRAALARESRPDIMTRRAPRLASLVLGAALLLTAPATGLGTAASGGESLRLMTALGLSILSLVLGVGLGFLFVGLLRLAEGKDLILALALSMPILGWGVATALGIAPLAVVFAAGLVLANDARRRDMFFTILGELERPFTICLLLLSGVMLFFETDLPGDGVLWIMAIAFTLARPLALSLISSAGLGMSGSLPLSPLAIPLALTMMPGAGRLPLLIAIAFVASEAAWALRLRRTVAARS